MNYKFLSHIDDQQEEEQKQQKTTAVHHGATFSRVVHKRNTAKLQVNNFLDTPIDQPDNNNKDSAE